MDDKSSRAYWDYRAAEVKNEHELVYNSAEHWAMCDSVSRTLIAEFVKKDMKVIDIGCGYGRFYDVFRACGADYTGADFSKEMLKRAEHKHPDARFINMDIREDTLPEGEYDVVFECICASSVGADTLRRQMERMCKDNGICIMIEADEVRVWAPGARNLFA